MTAAGFLLIFLSFGIRFFFGSPLVLLPNNADVAAFWISIVGLVLLIAGLSIFLYQQLP